MYENQRKLKLFYQFISKFIEEAIFKIMPLSWRIFLSSNDTVYIPE